jgi:hypothetical protein
MLAGWQGVGFFERTTMVDTPKVELKNVKHVFTDPECNQFGGDLARAVGALRMVESEFDQVKAGYKARTTEAEAKIDSLSTNLVNGFEMRNEKCVVIYRPKEGKKDFYLEADFTQNNGSSVVILTEDMTQADYELELFEAESKFDKREEIYLFQPTESDRGILVVGKFGSKWFSALRVRIGKLELNERLDTEQPAFKHRKDAVGKAVKRAHEWTKKNLKEHADGFTASFDSVIEAHKERAE